MQKLCGVGEPCYGAIFAGEVHHRRAELAAADYCRLGVETEIAFRLGADLPQGGAPGEIAPAIDSCMAAIELIEDLHMITSGSTRRRWWPAMYGMRGWCWARR